MKMNNGVTAWAISPSKYVDEAVNNCEKWIQENMPEHKHSTRATNPFPTDYDPDLDTTKELDEDQMTEFRQPLQVQSHLEMSGILVQLGHIQRT